MSTVEAAMHSSNPRAPRRLTQQEKDGVRAKFLECGSIRQTAEDCKVNRDTVQALTADLRRAVKDWRKTLTDKLPAKATTAIERSLDDTDDVHKAASTGVQVLKGIGALQGDNSVVVNVQAVLTSMPAELREMLIVTPGAEKDALVPQDVVVEADPPVINITPHT